MWGSCFLSEVFQLSVLIAIYEKCVFSHLTRKDGQCRLRTRRMEDCMTWSKILIPLIPLVDGSGQYKTVAFPVAHAG